MYGNQNEGSIFPLPRIVEPESADYVEDYGRSNKRRISTEAPEPNPLPKPTLSKEGAALIKGWIKDVNCTESLASLLDASCEPPLEAARFLAREYERKKRMLDEANAYQADLGPEELEAAERLSRAATRIQRAWNDIVLYDGMQDLDSRSETQLEEIPSRDDYDCSVAILQSQKPIWGYSCRTDKHGKVRVKKHRCRPVDDPEQLTTVSDRPAKKTKMEEKGKSVEARTVVTDLTLDDSEPETLSRPQDSLRNQMHAKYEAGLDASSPFYSPPIPTPPSLSPPAQDGSMADAPPASELDPEPELCEEQQQVVRAALQGHNIFYTGSAGCGKSTVLRAMVKQLRARGKRVQVLAPTGMVALAIGGETTWVYAGWTPDHMTFALETLRSNAQGDKSSQRFRETDVIIIDEISMVENLHFERLNEVLKSGRHNSREPFGGVQIIVTGDFCQLPPVKPFRYCLWCKSSDELEESRGTYQCEKSERHVWQEEDKFAFRSKAWAECNFKCFHLGVVHRQRDAEFKALLEKCRLGLPFSNTELHLLRDHPLDPDFDQAVRLFPVKWQVAQLNDAEFKRLPGTPVSYKCIDWFDWKMDLHPALGQDPGSKKKRDHGGTLAALRDHRYENILEVKEGMLVMLLVNLNKTQGLVNGSQGVVIGFQPDDGGPNGFIKGKGDKGPTAGRLTKYCENQVDHFIKAQDTPPELIDPAYPGTVILWPVVRFHNGITRTIVAHCSVSELGDPEPHSLLSRTQVPLMAAWAISIHKAQGMTLERVEVNLARAFEEGQVYVALSRATALEGLKVVLDRGGERKMNELLRGGNRVVREFLVREFPGLRRQFPALGAVV